MVVVKLKPEDSRTDNETITFEKPSPDDGARMWEIASRDGTLDQNSSYTYIMMCEYFQDMCVVAKDGDQTIGFVLGFNTPEEQEHFFVWQVAIDVEYRGRGLAYKMIQHLLKQNNEKSCYIEATITPDNIPSRKLFEKIAREYDAPCIVEELFAEEIFPDDHKSELKYTIGPIKNPKQS